MPFRVEDPKPYNGWNGPVLCAHCNDPAQMSQLIREIVHAGLPKSEIDMTDWYWTHNTHPPAASLVFLVGINKDGSTAISCIPNAKSVGFKGINDPRLQEVSGFWHPGRIDAFTKMHEWGRGGLIWNLEQAQPGSIAHKEFYVLSTGVAVEGYQGLAKAEKGPGGEKKVEEETK
ncbi:hypothetical protein EJ08DRAFT_699119 [Tothia fuscella]|uniref:Uncharacterized protein n=1 Tax=Tothia fuscella TaxID=1048955 RepID=A0A9P4NNJ6_9PEZI|nr:hypothetical protein EJ08DRAFT_699119 [Tothia fuscella]